MWCHLPTIFDRRQTLRFAALTSLFVALITTLVLAPVAIATTGINKTINFQGRLLNAQGATVADGYYNMQFKIYQDGDGLSAGNTTGSPAGSLKWTETYINNGSATGAVQVKNGFFSVNLGSLNAFGSSVDWNQDTLFLSMNVAGSAVACTTFGTAPCTADGEMLPMKRMTTAAYALQAENANKLGGLSASNFVQLAQGVQADGSTNSSIFINKTASGNLVQLQNTAADVFTVTNAGDLTFGANANHTVSVATAGAGVAGKSLTVSAGGGGSGTGSAGGNLVLQGGAAGGTNANGGNVTIDGGSGTGSGTAGSINIGTNSNSTVQIGSTSISSGTQTINIGTNNTAGSTTNVTIGAGSSATGGTTAIQSKGNTTVATNGTTRATFDTSNNLYLGNGTSSTSPTSFTVRGTDSSNTGTAGGSITIQGGAATSGNANGGNLNLQSGNKAGTGTDGTINIGTSNTATVQIGNVSATGATQLINVGTNNTAGTRTDVKVGSTIGNSTTTIQGGSGGIQLAGDVTGSTTIDAISGFKVNGTAGVSRTCNSGEYLQSQVVVGGITTGGTCTTVAAGSASSTLQDVYNNSTTGAIINLNATNDGILIRDASSTVGGNLFAVQNSTGSTSYFNVTTSGASVAGTFSATGTINGATLSGGTLSGGNISGGTLSSSALTFGQTATTIGLTQAAASTAGGALTLQGGQGGTGTGSAGGAVTVQGGNGGGTNGNGGDLTLSGGVRTGTGTSGSVIIKTNNISRATFDTNGNLYLGNGTSGTAPANFTIQGTTSSATGVAGGTITLQGGNAVTGNANGGNLLLSGGTGVGTGTNGVVIVTTPTFQTATSDSSCYTGGALVASDCVVTSASLNGNSSIIVGFSANGKTAFLPDPAITTAGRIVYITAANGSNDFTLSVNGGGSVTNLIGMRQNTSATMIWNGSDWTAAGASSSTTLQAAYDNTLQSAGGAELIVSKTSATNGLTIRDSSANPVNGALLSIQTNSASNLFSVSSNVTEYVSNAGAELAGGTTSTFPSSTWAAAGSSTVSRNTTTANVATGQASVSVATTTAAGDGVKNTLTSSLTAGQHYNVSFTSKLSSGTFTDMAVYYSVDGSANSVTCTSGKAVKTSVWTKYNCTFTAPTLGITSSNAILIKQVGSGSARTFYIDNLSVTIAADYNYATDGSVTDNTNFSSNWVTAGSGVVVTRSTSDGFDASDSAQAAISTGGANVGVRNKLSISPLTSTLYRISVYAKQSSGAAFNDFKVRYSRDGGTNFADCVDYNTQTVTTTDWTQITCYVTTDGTAPTNPYVYFVEGSAVVRTYGVDTFSMTLAANTTPNVQIGGGENGGPTTLFTVDKGASAPIAANNDALLGSMYYDTTLGKLQCYEADGWGACGSSPDNIITISPEYTNAVMHGTGVGTMTSDICSDALNINDGSSSQPTICGTNQTFNFYNWTSPQSTSQSYGIYVTYQLPNTFKAFTSGSTSLQGRVDNTTNASVTYQIYVNSGSALTPCGGAITVTSSNNTWQTGVATGAADPSTCGYVAGDSIVFKITVATKSNANAYVGNLNFTFSNN